MSTELFAAIRQHATVRVRELLAGGANPNETLPTYPHERPLQVAIYELPEGGELDVLRVLLEHGADVNAWDGGLSRTPLMTAVCEPELAAAQLLLEAGADPNARSGEGELALRLAVEMGNLRMAELLLGAGATRMIDDWDGITGCSALGHAARELNLPMLKLLLAAGANPKILYEGRGPAEVALPPRDESNAQEWDAAFELLEGAKDRGPV